MTIRILSPSGSVGTPPVALTPPRRHLVGVTIGILDNGKPNADVLLGAAAAGLAERTRSTVGVHYTKNAARPAPEDQIKGLAREVQVVLTGSAD